MLRNRKSPRAKWHDYNGGDYFVTICTKNRDCYFGDVKNGEMKLTRIGEWAAQCVGRIVEIHQGVSVDGSVIMPNHVHMIISIDGHPIDVGLSHCGSPTDYDSPTNGDSPIAMIDTEMQRRANRCGRLSHIIGQFKSAVSRYANKHDILFGWQPRYYDHIIRNQLEMNRIADYIENNPINWELDRFYKT